MLGVFLDRDTMAPGDLDFSSLDAALPRWESYDKTAPDQVASRIDGATVVVINKVVLNKSVLEGASDLKLVCIAATGTNNVDLETAKRLGITVCNVRGYGIAAVSQHVLTLILALSTRLLDYHDAVSSGRWQRAEQFCFLDFPIRELDGKTLGIIGYGDLGRGVARLGEAFGMRILIAQRPGGEPRTGRVPMKELIPQVDVLTLHCPLTEHTQGLIGRNELTAMKSDAVLINAARGGIVDEDALVWALRSGAIGGAGVDVLSVEPPKDGNPLLSGGIPNLIVTPHVAWGSREARQRVVDWVAGNIQSYLTGQPSNVVV